MFVFIAILAICALLVKGQVSSTVEERILACSRLIADPQILSQVNKLNREDFRKVCDDTRRGLTCALDVINENANSPQQTNTGFPAEAVRNSIEQSLRDLEDTCGTVVQSNAVVGNHGNEVTCPTDIQRQLYACYGGFLQFSSASESERLSKCPGLYQSIECMERLVILCPTNPNVQEMMTAFPLDTLKSTIQSFCPNEQSGSSAGNSATGTDRCPRGPMVQQKVTECTQHMTSQAGSSNLRIICRNARLSIDCLQDIIKDCQNVPEWHQISSSVDQQRQNLKSMCGTYWNRK